MKNFKNNAFNTALWLIKIAETELKKSLNRSKILILGDNENANELCSLLNGLGAKTVIFDDLTHDLCDNSSFDCAFLFKYAENAALMPFMAENSLVIDTYIYEREQTVLYDNLMPFKRIRVVCISKYPA